MGGGHPHAGLQLPGQMLSSSVGSKVQGPAVALETCTHWGFGWGRTHSLLGSTVLPSRVGIGPKPREKAVAPTPWEANTILNPLSRGNPFGLLTWANSLACPHVPGACSGKAGGWDTFCEKRIRPPLFCFFAKFHVVVPPRSFPPFPFVGTPTMTSANFSKWCFLGVLHPNCLAAATLFDVV